MSKSISIYSIRKFWSDNISKVTTIRKIKEVIEIIEKRVEQHNAEYNDNITSDIVFESEFKVAQEYKL